MRLLKQFFGRSRKRCFPSPAVPRSCEENLKGMDSMEFPVPVLTTHERKEALSEAREEATIQWTAVENIHSSIQIALSIPELLTVILRLASLRSNPFNGMSRLNFGEFPLPHHPYQQDLWRYSLVSRSWHAEATRLLRQHVLITREPARNKMPAIVAHPYVTSISSLIINTGMDQSPIPKFPSRTTWKQFHTQTITWAFEILCLATNLTVLELKWNLDENFYNQLIKLDFPRLHTFWLQPYHSLGAPASQLYIAIARWRRLRHLCLHIPKGWFHKSAPEVHLPQVSAPSLIIFETKSADLATAWLLAGSVGTLKHLRIEGWSSGTTTEVEQETILHPFKSTLETIVLGGGDPKIGKEIANGGFSALREAHLGMRFACEDESMLACLMASPATLKRIHLGSSSYPTHIRPSAVLNAMEILRASGCSSTPTNQELIKDFHVEARVADWPFSLEDKVKQSAQELGIDFRCSVHGSYLGPAESS